MGSIAWCKMLLKAMFQWNVLLKSSFVAALVGTVLTLTYTNYDGTACAYQSGPVEDMGARLTLKNIL